MQAPPGEAGIELANWNWKVVRQFAQDRFRLELGRSSCLNYLHRLGFVLKRPKKRLLKADATKRAAFVELYVALREEAARTGAKIFFEDEALFRADTDLRGKWVLNGEPALVDSTSPSLKEKVVYYSAVRRETGEVEGMEVEGNCTAETSAAFLRQLRANHPEALIVTWDNGPAHHGEALRVFLATPDLRLRRVALPGYRPDDNADEPIWDWLREVVTANTCWGTKAKVRAQAGAFFATPSERTEEVTRRCRTALQASADALGPPQSSFQQPTEHVAPTLASLSPATPGRSSPLPTRLSTSSDSPRIGPERITATHAAPRSAGRPASQVGVAKNLSQRSARTRQEVVHMDNTPQFTLGFKDLAAKLGADVVGEPVENEHYWPDGSISVQTTTKGVMWYSKTGNQASFIPFFA